MKLDLGDYFIETDSRQYKVKDKSIEIKRKDGTITNKTIGYFRTLKEALKFTANKTILDNNDINTILNKLNALEDRICKL